MNYLDYLFKNPKPELIYNKDYEFLIAVMLSAQTTDKRVNKVTSVLFLKYPLLKDLKNAKIENIEDIVRELGNYRKKAIGVIEIAKILDDSYNGIVPKDRKALENLPMVGRKTTNVVLSTLYNIPTIAVDTHVNRVSKRLNIAKDKDNVIDVEKKLQKYFPKEKWSKLHMQLVLFGRYYCLSRNPKCKNCKLNGICKEKKKKL